MISLGSETYANLELSSGRIQIEGREREFERRRENLRRKEREFWRERFMFYSIS